MISMLQLPIFSVHSLSKGMRCTQVLPETTDVDTCVFTQVSEITNWNLYLFNIQNFQLKIIGIKTPSSRFIELYALS